MNRWLVAALSFSLLTPCASPQATKGTVSGKVRDLTGAGIPSATVVMKKNTEVISTTQSNKHGFYVFPDVKAGTYSLVEKAADGEKSDRICIDRYPKSVVIDPPPPPCQTIEINFDAPATPAPRRVRNADPVVVRVVNVSPFNECKVDKKREEIVEEGSLVNALLGVFGPLAGIIPPPILTVSTDKLKAEVKGLNLSDAQAELTSSAAERAQRLIGQAAARQQVVLKQVLAKAEYFRLAALFAKGLRKSGAEGFEKRKEATVVALRDARDPGILPAEPIPTVLPEISKACVGGGFTECEQDLKKIDAAEASKAVKGARLPSTASVEIATAAAERFIRAHEFDLAQAPVSYAELGASLDNLVSATASLKAAIGQLEKKVASLNEIYGVIAAMGTSFTQEFSFILDRNAKVTGTVTCTDVMSKDPTMDPVAFSIVYQDPPRFSLSAGLMISGVTRHAYSVEPQADPTVTSADNLKYKIADASSAIQVVPFTFVNTRVGNGCRRWDRDFTFNLAAGVGVNPNGGTKEVEVGLGPSLGIGNVYLQTGFHFARPAALGGGFKSGDVVFKDFPLPVSRAWETGWGVSILYRIPLK
jgi:hypothetical protein